MAPKQIKQQNVQDMAPKQDKTKQCAGYGLKQIKSQKKQDLVTQTNQTKTHKCPEYGI